MFERILTAYDDSESSMAAVELAGRMASGLDARLLIAHVVGARREERDAKGPEDVLSDATRKDCEEWDAKLGKARDRARAAASAVGVGAAPEVETRVLVGKVGDRLLELVQEESIDLLAAGTQGIGHVKQHLSGSLSQWLLEHAHDSIELLFVREQLPPEPAASIVVGCDGSDWSKRAVKCGEHLARALGGPLVLTYVAGYPAPFADSAFLAPDAREGLRKELHDYGERMLATCRELVSADMENVIEDVHEGHVREEMLQAVEQRYPSIAVVGTRGARGFTGLLIGSVTRDLLDHSKSPVLVTRLPDGAENSN